MKHVILNTIFVIYLGCYKESKRINQGKEGTWLFKWFTENYNFYIKEA